MSTVHTRLVAAFPAEFQTAISQVTLGTQMVYTAREARTLVRTLEVHIRPPTSIEVDQGMGGIGEPQILWRYSVRIEKASGDDTDLDEFSREAFVHFHGKRAPDVPGLRHMRVENIVADINPEEGPAVAIVFDLVAVTREPITTA